MEFVTVAGFRGGPSCGIRPEPTGQAPTPASYRNDDLLGRGSEHAVPR